MTLVQRSEFERRLKSVIENAGGFKQHALLYLNLEGLKIVNDDFGVVAKEFLWQQLHECLSGEFGQGDVLAQLENDKFGLLLHNRSQDQAMQSARLLRTILQNSPMHWKKGTVWLGMSIGLVILSAYTRELADVLAAAESAYREARCKGNNSICIHSTDC